MAKHASTKFSDLENPFDALKKLTSENAQKSTARLRLTKLQPLKLTISQKPAVEEEKKDAAVNESQRCDDAFEREMSRNMHMQGARKIKFEDISFESDVHNIFDPFYSSESDDGDDYSNTSDEQLSEYDSESQRSSQDDESSYTSDSSQRGRNQLSQHDFDERFLDENVLTNNYMATNDWGNYLDAN